MNFKEIGILMGKSGKIFISLPMRGHSVEEIKNRRNAIYESAITALCANYELIDNLWLDEEPPVKNRIWYLGKSIQAMGEADLVIFSYGWALATGCIAERVICDLYNIPRLDEADLATLKHIRYPLE